jgi:putative Mg2+ transporter-C (MgtC) family protein
LISNQDMLVRLSLAIVFGSVVGIERGRAERAAGFRTHALVSLGSCLFMVVSQFGFTDVLGTPNVGLDPSRIAAQVVSGIGFLGAGTIIFWREKVRGLTTAASIWSTAAIGLAVGSGLWVPAAGATVGCLLILSIFKPIEQRLATRQHAITLCVDDSFSSLKELESLLAEHDALLDRIAIRPSNVFGEDLVELRLKKGSSEAPILTLVAKLRQMPGVRSITADTKVILAEQHGGLSSRHDAVAAISEHESGVGIE